MRLLIATILTLIISTMGYSSTIRVPADHATIQAAIDAAVNGDTVHVAPGTYVENLNLSGKEITLMSERGPLATIIDGNQAGSVVTIIHAGGLTSVLEGFTITNGVGSAGGGINCYGYSFPRIRNNIIRGNTADYGGGLCASEVSQPEISGNVIHANSSRFGGGLYIGNLCIALVDNNIITDNTASDPDFGGGGLFLRKNQAGGVIKNNLISGNSAVGPGGGICQYYYASVALLNNTIINNSTDLDGGGLYIALSHSSMINNVVANNASLRFGGGIYCTYDSIFDMQNSTLAYNIADNHGGGMYIHNSDATIVNSIFWNNEALAVYPPSDELFIGTSGYFSTVDLRYSDVRGGLTNIRVDFGSTLNLGGGMIDADPLFVNSVLLNFHIPHASPCRDAGQNSAVTVPKDFEGDPRIASSAGGVFPLGGPPPAKVVDMGADEYYLIKKRLPGHSIN